VFSDDAVEYGATQPAEQRSHRCVAWPQADTSLWRDLHPRPQPHKPPDEELPQEPGLRNGQ